MNYHEETAVEDVTSILQRGLTRHRQGNLELAEHHYRQILNIVPTHADALHLLGVLLNQKNDHPAAVNFIRRAIEILPQQPIYHCNLGNALRDGRQHEAAIDSYKKAILFKPDLVEAYINLGIAYQQLSDFDQAVSAYQKAIALKPDSAEAYFNLANTFKVQGLFSEAIDSYRQAVTINPSFAEALYNLSIVLEHQGQRDGAIDCLNQCLRIQPQWAEACNNLGNLLKRSGLTGPAISLYRKAIQLKPGLCAAHINLGNMFRTQGKWPQAIGCYQKALQINSLHAEAHLNLAIALVESDCPDKAVEHFRHAVHIDPNLAEAYNYMGVTLADLGKRGAAIDCFEKALTLIPDDTEVRSHYIHQLQQVCDWRRLQSNVQQLETGAEDCEANRQISAQAPFICMARNFDLARQLRNARAWCRKIKSLRQHAAPQFSFDSRHQKTDKVTIGYLSADFHDHATAHLMLSVFGLHDRNQFNINGYSYGPDDHSVYRQTIRMQCDQFVDIREMSHFDAAQRIYSDGVDILVDLKGHTKGSRLCILAFRPAPVQVHFLGYPGTIGADFIDYLITDRVVTPLEHAAYYCEQLVFMPHSYQVNDHLQKIGAGHWTRAEHGLPDSGFVFSSFNLPYKIDPLMFDTWMRILYQVPGSVLWLLRGSEAMMKNLQREARDRGVDPSRLVFAPKLPKGQHLARLCLVDLALDTRIVNGHTTTSDSLWAGVPVITLLGDQFAARVSASLLTAIGLSDLIVSGLDDYEGLAVRLACHSDELKEVKTRLARNRLTAPLFDTPRYVRHLEAAYQEMWQIFKQGHPARQFAVGAD